MDCQSDCNDVNESAICKLCNKSPSVIVKIVLLIQLKINEISSTI